MLAQHMSPDIVVLLQASSLGGVGILRLEGQI